jgi:hypothetical protein
MQTIAQSTSCAGSLSRSSQLSEESDLGLSEIGPDDGPADWPEPSWTVQLAHAAFILSIHGINHWQPAPGKPPN